MNEGKSFEQISEEYVRKIRETKGKILDDFYIAYAAQLSHLEGLSLNDICLIEQEPYYRMSPFNDEGQALCRRYWFEHKPKFEAEE